MAYDPYRSNQSDPYNRVSIEPYEYPTRDSQIYPPTHYAGSSESLASENPLDAGGASAGYGTEKSQHARGLAPVGKRSNTRRWLLVGLAVLVIAAIAGGIAGWRVNGSKASPLNLAAGSSSTSGSGTSSGGTTSTSSGTSLQVIPGTAGIVKSDPNDPSNFEKDSRLHVSFAGLAYTPLGAQEPMCGATQANVTEDIQLISQLTTRIRMYGSACNQSSLVLQAIQDTKVNLTVWLGAYIGDNATVNTQQMTETIAVLQKYGTKHVSGITVGNEYILDSLNPTTATTFIVGQMATFRSMMKAAGFNLPVGTADAGSEITTALATGADFVMANVHPFFGGLPIAQAANWTWDFFNQEDVSVAALAPNKPPVYIAETGWPSGSLSAANLTDGAAVAGIPQLQTFLDTYPCTANYNNTMYFYFEVFDEPWKDSFGGVEPFWGLFDANKVLKNVNLPTCVLPASLTL